MLFRNSRNQRSLQATLAVCLLCAVSKSSWALNIALTNDDGWNAIGISALRDALVAAGHTVVLVGSSENQSGMSNAIDLGANNLRITKQYEDGIANGGSDQYSLALASGAGAKPATAALLAITIAGQSGKPVDLLISGINAGANTGAWTNLSGTVGAAMTALSYVKGYSVPAIAISTDERFGRGSCPAEQAIQCETANSEHFKKVAAWMVKFVAVLERQASTAKPQKKLLPTNVGLNINYPTQVIHDHDEYGKPIYRYVEEIQGVVLATQGKLAYSGGTPKAYTLGCYRDCVRAEVGVVLPAGVTATVEVKDIVEEASADVLAFSAGKVTIVPFTIDMTTSAPSVKKLADELNRK